MSVYDLTSGRNFVAITLSLDYVIPAGVTPKGLYVGGTGDVKLDGFESGTGQTLKAMAAGIIHPVSFSKIYMSGTTATNLVLVY